MLNRALLVLFILSLGAACFLGYSYGKLRKENAVYLETQERIEKEIKQGWIVLPQGAFVLTPVGEHQSCMGCHTRERKKIIVPEGLICPTWKTEVNE